VGLGAARGTSREWVPVVQPVMARKSSNEVTAGSITSGLAQRSVFRWMELTSLGGGTAAPALEALTEDWDTRMEGAGVCRVRGGVEARSAGVARAFGQDSEGREVDGVGRAGHGAQEGWVRMGERGRILALCSFEWVQTRVDELRAVSGRVELVHRP
jgi:hypothetical protein